MTAEELWQLPDDDHQYDLIDGVLYRMAPPGGDHGYLSVELSRRIANFVEPSHAGRTHADTGFILSREPADTVLAPDVAFVRADRIVPPDRHRGFLDQAPDLAIEVRSPGNTRAELARMAAIYLRAGVSLVWLVDPDRRTITVRDAAAGTRILSADDELEGGSVLPGFRLPLSVFFG
jgi:Uma2 family endonuclease